METLITDPRPDLSQYDEAPFTAILKEVYSFNEELCLLLHGFRCQGIIFKNQKLQPVISQKLGWENKEEYEKERKRLLPYRDVLMQVIKNITAVKKEEKTEVFFEYREKNSDTQPEKTEKGGRVDGEAGIAGQTAVLSDTGEDTIYTGNLFGFSC